MPVFEDVIKIWTTQLVGDETLRSAIVNNRTVEVRVFAHGGQVRKQPIIVINNQSNSV